MQFFRQRSIEVVAPANLKTADLQYPGRINEPFNFPRFISECLTFPFFQAEIESCVNITVDDDCDVVIRTTINGETATEAKQPISDFFGDTAYVFSLCCLPLCFFTRVLLSC